MIEAPLIGDVLPRARRSAPSDVALQGAASFPEHGLSPDTFALLEAASKAGETYESTEGGCETNQCGARHDAATRGPRAPHMPLARAKVCRTSISGSTPVAASKKSPGGKP